MTESEPRIAVVGPGAIGTTVAAALHEVGRTPELYGRRVRDRLELSVGEQRIVVPGPVRVEAVPASRPADLIFLAVKATQVEGAASLLRSLVSRDTVICALQNGVEQEAIIRRFVTSTTGSFTVLPSVVWFPAQTEPDGSVRLRARPNLTVPDVAAAQLVVEALRDTRFSLELASDFASVAWRKLLQNAVAGFMALAGRRAGIFARDDVGAAALAYLRECLAVARAEGAQLPDDVPEQILQGLRDHPPDLGTSILADRVANRPLEWDVRNGVIGRRAREHGIPTPLSDLVVPLLAAASDGPG